MRGGRAVFFAQYDLRSRKSDLKLIKSRTIFYVLLYGMKGYVSLTYRQHHDARVRGSLTLDSDNGGFFPHTCLSPSHAPWRLHWTAYIVTRQAMEATRGQASSQGTHTFESSFGDSKPQRQGSFHTSYHNCAPARATTGPCMRLPPDHTSSARIFYSSSSLHSSRHRRRRRTKRDIYHEDRGCALVRRPSVGPGFARW